MRYFESKYKTEDFAAFYAQKHGATAAKRLSNWMERAMMARGLRRVTGGERVETILDLPSGTGRFLAVLAGFGREVIAMDTAETMLREGLRLETGLGDRHRPITGSAMAIPLRNASVDVVFCSRLVHHFGDEASLVAIFKEMARVARRGVVVSFFDARSYYAWRRRRKERRTGIQRGRFSISRSRCTRLARTAGLTPLGMNALMRFHAEITAAAFSVNGAAT